MDKIYEIDLVYKYVIRSKMRPGVNFSTRSIRNPSRDDEDKVAWDTKRMLTKEQMQMVKKLQKEKNIGITLDVVNVYATKDSKLWGKPKLTVPDVDNFFKLYADSISKGLLYADDNIVFSGQASKYWGETSMATVKITYWKV